MLKELDSEIELSEGHRADMMLDLAGLDSSQKVMIQASIQNERNFDKIAGALLAQYPLIHFKECSNRPSVPGKVGGRRGKGKGKGKFGKRRFVNHKHHVKQANMAYDTAEDTAYTADYNEDVEPYNDPAYDER